MRRVPMTKRRQLLLLPYGLTKLSRIAWPYVVRNMLLLLIICCTCASKCICAQGQRISFESQFYLHVQRCA